MNRITVKGNFRDILAFVRHLRARDRIFGRTAPAAFFGAIGSDAGAPAIARAATVGALTTARAAATSAAPAAPAAPATPAAPPPMNRLAAAIHPRAFGLEVTAVRRETASTTTYRLEPVDGISAGRGSAGVKTAGKVFADADGLPVFRAGQYLTIAVEAGGVICRRPYSISSTPADALDRSFYEITVKRTDPGFIAPFISDTWKTGTRIQASGPSGLFYHEPLRDGQTLFCLAGGCVVTPFRSLIPDSLARYPESSIVLLYGITEEAELLWGGHFHALENEYAGRFRFMLVCSGDDPGWSGKRGFIDARLISECASMIGTKPGECAFFICGPRAMHRFLDVELAPFGIRPGRIRRESSGGANGPGANDRFMNGDAPGAAVYSLTVIDPFGDELTVPAAGNETVLAALERAGTDPPSQCRSGQCGYCRSRLVSGDVVMEMTPEEHLRGADRKFGYFHPCCAYPRSDLAVTVPPNPR